ICLTGGTIGKLGIVQEGLGKLYLNQRVGRFDILDENIFEKEYVYWIARSVQDTIKQLAWGAAIPNVSPKQIEQLNFSIPKIDEQRAIIEFLNDLKSNTIQEKEYFNQNIENHIIELHQTNINLKLATKEITHQLDLIKNLRQAFLREAMQGLLVSNETSDNKTGADLLAEIQAEKAQLLKEKKINKPKPLAPITEDEIPFAIPENWTWCRLGEVIEYTDNLDIQKKLPADEIINYVDIDAIDNKKYIIREAKVKKVSELSSRARRILRKDYIIYSIVRPYLRNIACI